MKLPPPPWIAAHRGALPLLENTIPALERAVEEGADLLEFDVQATVDDVLVLDSGAEVRISQCPDGHGKIKSPMCCGSDMACAV